MNRNRHLRIMCCFWDDDYKTCTRDSYTFEREIRADERAKIVSDLERLKDVVWQDTDSELRIVKANAWDKIDLLNKAIEMVRGGKKGTE